MRADEQRSQRLNILAKLWHKPHITEIDLFNKAMKWGVTEQTARSYIKSVKLRYPKK